jgi:hypothetical protein
MQRDPNPAESDTDPQEREREVNLDTQPYPYFSPILSVRLFARYTIHSTGLKLTSISPRCGKLEGWAGQYTTVGYGISRIENEGTRSALRSRFAKRSFEKATSSLVRSIFDGYYQYHKTRLFGEQISKCVVHGSSLFELEVSIC